MNGDPVVGSDTDAEPFAVGIRASTLAARTRGAFIADVERRDVTLDTQQRGAVAALAASDHRGAYLWGDVGRGKTMLADAYFRAIPTSAKRRVHFHAFFRELHGRIVADRRPIEATVSEMLVRDEAVLFDEFHVHDVSDAVFLARTLEAILDLDILIVATSNDPPSALLPDPEFHDRFLPTIALIEQHLTVIEMGPGPDYRATSQGRPNGFSSSTWTARAGTAAPRACDAATFSFAELCVAPRSSWDFLDLAAAHRRIVVTGIPALDEVDPQTAARFCVLIDVLADADVAFDGESAAHWSRLRHVDEPPVDLARTLSRLSLLTDLTRPASDRSTMIA